MSWEKLSQRQLKTLLPPTTYNSVQVTNNEKGFSNVPAVSQGTPERLKLDPKGISCSL